MTRLNMQQIAKFVGTFNSRKFGRHRRGTVCITAVSWVDGMAEIRFAYNRRRFLRVFDQRTNRNYKFAQYGFSDFRKLLKTSAHPPHRR